MTSLHMMTPLSFRCGAVATMLLLAGPVEAQVNQSDITGPPTTGSMIAGGTYSPTPGTVAADASPTVTAAITTVGAAITAQFSSGNPITVTTASGATVTIPPAVQATTLSVLTGTSAPAEFIRALGAGGAGGAAADLAVALEGLISSPATGQLAAAVGHFNALVNASSDAFIASPPAEFLAVQMVLSQMVAAAQAAG